MGLILKRKAGEKIIIGNDIRIEIRSISSGRATICIEAPANVRIMREEVLERQEGVGCET